jgi:2-haloalkanoic acid dehalogenase type II
MRPVVFDAYGTLFDVAAAARRAAAEPGGEALAAAWPRLAADWRVKQLQYAWLRTIAGAHADFERVTAEALDWALEAAGIAADPALRARLAALYRELDAYPEVPETLARLRAAGHPLAILSNGAPGMLEAAVAAAGLAGTFDAILSAEAVGAFKPARAVYDLAGARFGADPGAVVFVSSNGWDAACAAGYGFETVWANRAGEPVDRLPWRPAHVLADLGRVPEIAADPARRRFVTSDGIGLAYWDEGAGPGPALLCLPGLTRNAEDFAPVVAAFAGRARVLRLDLRGRGASQWDPAYLNYSILREAADVVELLDRLGIARVAVLGTSRGGLIAMTLAATARERLAGVVLNDVGPVVAPAGVARILGYLGLPPPWPDLDAAAAAAAQADRFPGVDASAWRAQLAVVMRETPEGLALRYDPALRRAVIEQAGASVEVDLWPLFDLLAGVPLLAIRGATSDILAPETAAEMRRRRPDMGYVEIRDRGHVPFLDEPEALDAIARFLDGLGR